MKTLAISNYKGGVGKTTTAVNLAHVFADGGLRVLFVDLDPQASATDFFALYDTAQNKGISSIDLLYGHAAVKDTAFHTAYPNIDVVPSLIELIDQNELLLHEQTLKFALDDVSDDYDIAILDCSPVLKRLTFNAYAAASAAGMVIIPVKLDSSVMRGTALTVAAMRSVTEALRLPMPKWRILRTCVPGRSTKSEDTGMAVLDNYYPDNQFKTVIHASTKVCEGSWRWEAVVESFPASRPAADYRALAKEVLGELS